MTSHDIQTDRLRDTWLCRTILGDGDGPPGKPVNLHFVHRADSAEAAECHAENLHDGDMLKYGDAAIATAAELRRRAAPHQ